MPLLAVDDAADDPRGRFDHECSRCHTIRRGLALATDLRVERHPSGLPHLHGLAFDCGACGSTESFNCNLGPEDADPDTPNNYPWRAEQARLIRAAMAHPQIHLERREWPQGATPPQAPVAAQAPAQPTELPNANATP
jgi:hypothetical protein